MSNLISTGAFLKITPELCQKLNARGEKMNWLELHITHGSKCILEMIRDSSPNGDCATVDYFFNPPCGTFTEILSLLDSSKKIVLLPKYDFFQKLSDAHLEAFEESDFSGFNTENILKLRAAHIRNGQWIRAGLYQTGHSQETCYHALEEDGVFLWFDFSQLYTVKQTALATALCSVGEYKTPEPGYITYE